MSDQPDPVSVIHARDLTKAFGSLVANDDVSLEVRSGEIHAVVGENGAGKTTLMRMLSGEMQPDSGSIEVRGNVVRIRNPQEAVQFGIGMVRQHYSVVAEFSLLENLLLGVSGSSARSLTRSDKDRGVEFLSSEGFNDPQRTTVKDLSVDELQRFEIARLLYTGAEILILDEPTAVLGPIEVERLYVHLRALADAGRAIVVITHKLDEVQAYSDRVTVMRGGKTVLTTGSMIDKNDLLSAMFGSHLNVAREQSELISHHEDHTVGPVLLSVEGLDIAGNDGRKRVQSVSFEVRSGEILCVVGVEGNGQTHLMDALAGLRSAEGVINVDGADVTGDSPRQRFHHGVRFVSEDRHRWDVLSDATVTENMLAHDYADGHPLGNTNTKGKTITSIVTSVLKQFDVRPLAPQMRLGNLSGGNQQRVVVGRESAGTKRVLLLSHPTRGLDVVGAAKIVGDALEQRASGIAIVWNTADLDEAYIVADTFLVMYRGQIAYFGKRETTTRDKLAMAMSGSSEG